ncbi:hypothetical protein CHS0354_018085 [Potamilus streckersoni]|uniref:Uncharacterized protein n=1 Tax=Potamilus streckersoni TaxID=2493646 RepID=A0AAE0TJJ9_9BIVA|nr:hypothetical protein CHS0354_018085 [Potamilus streckersoni]
MYDVNFFSRNPSSRKSTRMPSMEGISYETPGGVQWEHRRAWSVIPVRFQVHDRYDVTPIAPMMDLAFAAPTALKLMSPSPRSAILQVHATFWESRSVPWSISAVPLQQMGQ